MMNGTKCREIYVITPNIALDVDFAISEILLDLVGIAPTTSC